MENIVNPILQIKDVCVAYSGDMLAVKHVSAAIEKNTITAIIGAFRMRKKYVAPCGEPYA